MININEYRDRVYRFILTFVKSKSIADDLTQDVMLKYLQHQDRINRFEKIDSYIFRMAKNQVIDHFNRIAKDKVYKEEVWSEIVKNRSSENFVHQIYAHELENELEQWLQHLPPRQKEIFIMNRKEGLTLKEISNQLNLAPNTVRNHLFRANAWVKSKMKPEYLTFLVGILGIK